jgi:hypothetical protein
MYQFVGIFKLIRACMFLESSSVTPEDARSFLRIHAQQVLDALFDGFLRLVGKLQGNLHHCDDLNMLLFIIII